MISLSALAASSSSAASTSATSSTSTSSTSTSSTTEEMFLTLLVAQLKNQDPLNPTDGTQFVSELAQFSELENVIGIKDDIESYASSASSSSTSTSSSSSASSTTTSST